MIRFDGNSILIADGDLSYARQLGEALSYQGANCSVCANISSAKETIQTHDFDLVICNYHLPDGIIHELIDWCANNLQVLPIFTCLEYPFISDLKIIHKHSIVDTFSKSDSRRIFAGVSRLLFDFQDFHDSLVEVLTPDEINFQIKVGQKIYNAQAVEVNSESLLLQMETKIPNGTFGLLKYRIGKKEQRQHFTVPGLFQGQQQDAEVFTINKNYACNWTEFLNYLHSQQNNITHFIKKASGL